MNRILVALIIFSWTAFPALAQASEIFLAQVMEIDLDGDGTNESIVMQYLRDGDFALIINDSIIESYLEPDLSGFEIVDLDTNDRFKEILIPTFGPSDDPECLIYTYDDGTIIEVGSIWGSREITGDGLIFATGWAGFWAPTYLWVLNTETHTLEEVSQDRYDVNSCCNSEGTDCDYTVIESFPIYTDRTETEVLEMVEVGSTVSIVSAFQTLHETQEHSYVSFDWYLIKTETNLLGWANLWDFMDNLDGLCMAD